MENTMDDVTPRAPTYATHAFFMYLFSTQLEFVGVVCGRAKLYHTQQAAYGR